MHELYSKPIIKTALVKYATFSITHNQFRNMAVNIKSWLTAFSIGTVHCDILQFYILRQLNKIKKNYTE